MVMKTVSSSGSVLRYHVVHCTSEHEDHIASELHSFNIHSQGWQSARSTEYPVTLIVQFEGDVRLRRIKLLSHEYKIASKVELFMGVLETEASQTQEASWQGCSFKRVGFLTLSTNEENDFNARELKKVKLDVGVVAIQFLGDLVSSFPPTVLGPLADRHSSTPKVGILEEMRPKKAKQDNPDAYLDEETRIKIEQLNNQKQVAVKKEDFMKAKEIKEHIEHLKKCSAQIAELEKQKQLAVKKEDYERAHKIKEECITIRESMRNWKRSRELKDHLANIHHDIAQLSQYPESPHIPRINDSNSRCPSSREESRSDESVDSVSKSQQQDHEDNSNVPYDDKPIKGMQQGALQYYATSSEEANADNSEKPPSSRKQVTRAKNHDDAPVSALSNTVELEVLEDNSHLKPKGNNIPEFLEKEMYGKSDWERDLILHIAKATDNSGPPVSLPKRHDHSELVQVFGLFATRCLLSSRILREGALNVISTHLGTLPSEKLDIVVAALKYMKIGVSDKIAAVYLASLNFLREVLKFCGKSVKRNQIAPLVDPVLTGLMTKLADANSRIKDQTEKSLLFLCGRACVGAAAVCQNCLKIPQKEGMNGWKPIAARLNLLTQLVPKYGFTEKSGLTAQSVLKLVALGLDNANIEARRAAIVLFTEVYRLDDSVISFVEAYEKSKPLLYKEIMSMLKSSPLKNNNGDQEAPNSPDTSLAHVQETIILEALSFKDLDKLVPCSFCGELFPNDNYTNYHWCVFCKVLTQCPLCNNVVLVKDLNSHLIQDCDKKARVELCETCQEVVISKEMYIHKNSGNCKQLPRGKSIRCPLCKEDLENGHQFNEHLMNQCLSHERPPQMEVDPNYRKWLQYRKKKGIGRVTVPIDEEV